jgi:hypothetical protein
MNEETARAELLTQCEVTNPQTEVIGIVVQKGLIGVKNIIVILASGRWVLLNGIASLKDARALCAAANLPDQPCDARTGVFFRETKPDPVKAEIDCAMNILIERGGKVVPFIEFDDNLW